ncbi:hypothetical protein TTHERM_01122810 (macronuclear) [Tetrahymena thermophila SB210]|uniref:Uncharacterized protein n=1 Tax=Tetrahymena thermophila (strain SB210) TaxID=312017 RepID=Q23S11_TETTS|nr:hypothetical protein TTHERM_01122810 [Tetrahymena thermophila SB210]EAR99336.1 hypothetical protein TTHERM_01122810 [Tetrahymena thermophila SB210]|eukprot:XP_001019581.1 hypothetical protein TTHERM_01122810 [Tetrahymena thermophila SB210]
MDIIDDSYQVFCQKHKHHLVNLIQISLNTQQLLNCEECVLETGNTKDYISIQTIKKCRDDFIFQNWPPLSDYNLLQKIQKILDDNNGIINRIEQEFNKIIQQIIEQLEQQKKIILKEVNEKQKSIENLIKIYNQISGKDELKSFFKQNNKSLENNEKILYQFIQDKISNCSQNTEILLQAIKKVTHQNKPKAKGKQLTNFENDNEPEEQFQYQQFLLSNCLSNRSESQQNQSQIQLLFGKAQQCLYKSSKQIKVVENNFITLKKNSSSQHGNVYFNYGLSKQKNYIFRFQFHDKAGDSLLIGLNDNKQEIKYIQKACKIFCSNDQKYGGKVEKGEYFYQVYYPEYSSINSLSETQNINPEKTYYLSIVFGNKENYKTTIDLIYFQEIEN